MLFTLLLTGIWDEILIKLNVNACPCSTFSSMLCYKLQLSVLIEFSFFTIFFLLSLLHFMLAGEYVFKSWNVNFAWRWKSNFKCMHLCYCVASYTDTSIEINWQIFIVPNGQQPAMNQIELLTAIAICMHMRNNGLVRKFFFAQK